MRPPRFHTTCHLSHQKVSDLRQTSFSFPSSPRRSLAAAIIGLPQSEEAQLRSGQLGLGLGCIASPPPRGGAGNVVVSLYPWDDWYLHCSS